MSRRFHVLAGTGTLVHESVELAAGTGVIGSGTLGFPGAVAASIGLNAYWLWAATRFPPADRSLAVLSSVAVGVPFLHFTLWPWTARGGIPRLTEAEGLPRRLLPAYNAILYAWATAGILALAVETPRRHRRLGVLSLAGVLAARPLVRRHFQWIEAEAVRNPTWWNRAWR